MHDDPWKKSTSRRSALKAFGGLGAMALLDCGPLSTLSDGGSEVSSGWATQGTSLLNGKSYGNPFSSGLGSTCTVHRSSTEGPCHAPSLVRQDVSEGSLGVPMRLELLIVNAQCLPVPNATVEIWMCDTKGVYSGDIDGSNDAFCTGGSAAAAAARWGRGTQTAGSDGRVTFDANFPGWYSGRATHVHFKVSVGSTAYLTSQLFFPETIKSDIYSNVSSYLAPSGNGYILNANDNVLTQASLVASEVVVSTAQQSDGALLAWKAITVNA